MTSNAWFDTRANHDLPVNMSDIAAENGAPETPVTEGKAKGWTPEEKVRISSIRSPQSTTAKYSFLLQTQANEIVPANMIQ
jgi:hypothetical protein